jgi:hypothetical protein
MTAPSRTQAPLLRALTDVPAELDEASYAPQLRAIERAKKLAPQLRSLARAHTVLGLSALALALVASVILGAAALFARSVSNEALALGGAVVGGLALLGAPWLALGFGLRRRAHWARSLGVACGALLLPFAPLGSALGVWTLFVVLSWSPRLGEFAASE